MFVVVAHGLRWDAALDGRFNRKNLFVTILEHRLVCVHIRCARVVVFSDAELCIKVTKSCRLGREQRDDFGETLKRRNRLALLLVLMSLVVEDMRIYHGLNQSPHLPSEFLFLWFGGFARRSEDGVDVVLQVINLLAVISDESAVLKNMHRKVTVKAGLIHRRLKLDEELPVVCQNDDLSVLELHAQSPATERNS